MMWLLCDNGQTIGTKGSENGVIIRDEEHEDGARITLEKETDRGIPYAITCGIYGLMVHTVYCSEDDKDIKYENIKQDIERILIRLNDSNYIEFVEMFIKKY